MSEIQTERGRIRDRSWQGVKDDTGQPMMFPGWSQGEKAGPARWGQADSHEHAELRHSIEVGSPRGDGRLHGLTRRGPSSGNWPGVLEVPRHNGGSGRA